MACTAATLTGIPLDCGNIGGIKNVWLNNTSSVTSITSGLPVIKQTISGITDIPTVTNRSNVAIFSYTTPTAVTGDTLAFSIYDDGVLAGTYIFAYGGGQDTMPTPGTFTSWGVDDMMLFNMPTPTYDYLVMSLNSGAITSITLELISENKGDSIISIVSTDKFKKYSFRKGNASMSSVGARDDKNGTHFVKTDINMQFNKMTPEARKEAEQIAHANAYAIVLDNNNKYWFIGYGSYVTLANVAGNTGATMADANAYILDLTSETKYLPYEVVFEGAFTASSILD